MYLIRAAERRIVEHYPEDEMRTPMHMSMGQEAVSVGLCAALGEDGQVYGSYRSHALFLAKTDDPERFFGELYGRTSGTAHGKAGSMHLAAPDRGLMAASAIVGSTIPAAVGTAFANMRLGNGKRCAVLFGDGALEVGGFWESLNAACAMRVPVLFVCEDNGYAVHSAKAVRHGFDSIQRVVREFRCASVSLGRCTDVEVICRVVDALFAASVKEKHPVFLHVETYRYLDHIGITKDYDIGYRTREDSLWWHEYDPLDVQRKRLLMEHGVVEVEVREVERQIDMRLDAALVAAQEAPMPGPEELRVGVFA